MFINGELVGGDSGGEARAAVAGMGSLAVAVRRFVLKGVALFSDHLSLRVDFGLDVSSLGLDVILERFFAA